MNCAEIITENHPNYGSSEGRMNVKISKLSKRKTSRNHTCTQCKAVFKSKTAEDDHVLRNIQNVFHQLQQRYMNVKYVALELLTRID
nr:unnamed protein product [Callosobruchus analis]